MKGVRMYTTHVSDNPFSAGNQQERLITIGWITGFVDGEGCFSISFLRQPDRGKRKGYRTGYQVLHEFVVTQGQKSLRCLYELRGFFQVGQVIVNKRYDNHKEHLYRFVVRKREDLLTIIIPFFRRYPMRTSKQQDFEKFARCVGMVQSGEHLVHKGLLAIVEIAQTMNRQKFRTNVTSILRGHTPEVRDTGS